ncbi:hypothetical protein, conserved [Eimeria tenella]|uniref:Uncharacterized protein n=1 Tax=Eimeria tenella TaxID=5802 RepID=U6KWI4_EIMTE|nr:hypothetical protein, conserved [Eimeria tenella]CDJ41288.1 hypothetical protein, conserved [Eimeria tenella]|eukprot:XP_013232038.1 hypothetical protein, conserved [Eimeria tenella]
MEMQLQLLESLVVLQHYDGVYIHGKLLPALLARLPKPAAAAALRRTGDKRLQVYARLLKCLSSFPAASPVSADLLRAIIEGLPAAVTFSSCMDAAADAIAALHQLECFDYSSFSAAEAALLRDRRQTLQQLRPAHIQALRKAYEAFKEHEEGDENAWEELLLFLRRVESALERAGVLEPSDSQQQQQQQQEQQQQQQQPQEQRQQQQQSVVVHTYSSSRGHQSEEVPLTRGKSLESLRGQNF